MEPVARGTALGRVYVYSIEIHVYSIESRLIMRVRYDSHIRIQIIYESRLSHIRIPPQIGFVIGLHEDTWNQSLEELRLVALANGSTLSSHSQA